MKICSNCKVEKDLSEFSKYRSARDGLQNNCKDCNSKYRLDNKEEIDKKAAKYYLNNKDKKVRYYLKNKELISKKAAKYYLNNKEKRVEYAAKYRKENKEKIAKKNAKYHLDNKEKIAEKGAKYRKDHPEKGREYKRKRRAMKQSLNENYTKEDEAYTRNLFEHRCYNCESKDNLCIDHHKPLSKGYPLNRKNAVLLCKSCNSSKNDKSPEDFYHFWDLTFLQMKLGNN